MPNQKKRSDLPAGSRESIDPISIDLVQLDAELPIPSYAHEGDAGLDLYAREDASIAAGGGRLLMPTGISIAIPIGFCGLVMPRSGLALRHGISVVNAPGLIDAAYRQPESPMFGTRPSGFVHDEFLVNSLQEQSARALPEVERLMVQGMRKWIPDVKIQAPGKVLTERWSK